MPQLFSKFYFIFSVYLFEKSSQFLFFVDDIEVWDVDKNVTMNEKGKDTAEDGPKPSVKNIHSKRVVSFSFCCL